MKSAKPMRQPCASSPTMSMRSSSRRFIERGTSPALDMLSSCIDHRWDHFLSVTPIELGAGSVLDRRVIGKHYRQSSDVVSGLANKPGKGVYRCRARSSPLLACVLLLSLFDAVDATAPSGALLRLREGFREAASDAD